MNRVIRGSLLLALALVLTGCLMGKRSTPPAANSQAPQTTQPETEPIKQTPTSTQPQQQPPAPGALQVGEASGSYTAKGETVPLKYAYAGRGERFGTQSIIILLTDQPIPPEAIAEEIKSQKMLIDEKIRGLEYVIDNESYWVRFHPSQYQETRPNSLREFSIEGDVVRGQDEDNGDLSNGKYSRSVKFAAALIKEH
jgi:hypothetical protein